MVVSVDDVHYLDVAMLDALSSLMLCFVDRLLIVFLVGWEHVVETILYFFSNF